MIHWCKDCKYLIWYEWWWPYLPGEPEIETVKKCDHPTNRTFERDAITGELYTVDDGETWTPNGKNSKGDCELFEVGKHEENLGGEMSEEARQMCIKTYYPERKPKLPFWKR